MENHPLVSVICLCYNHHQFVTESLDSVIHQSYPNIELIVVDDCSADASVRVIETWLANHPKILFLKNDINIGNTKSFNQALKHAKGSYIIDLAADDVLCEDGIRLQIEKFQTSIYPNLGIVYGNAVMITENSTFDSYHFPVDDNQKVIKQRPTGNIYNAVLAGGEVMCSVSAMVKRMVYEQLNGYDETLAYEDLDLWIRASRNYDFDFIDAVLVKKRMVTNSLGSYFSKKNDDHTKRLNASVLRILQKAASLNISRSEDKALLKRVHYAMVLNFKNRHFTTVAKYLPLELQLRFSRKPL